MFGREPIGDRERARPRRAPRLRDHPPVAENRTRAIPAAVEKQQRAGGIGARRERPLGVESADSRRLKGDIRRDGPHRPDLLDARATLGPADRPGLCGKQRANVVDVDVGQDNPGFEIEPDNYNPFRAAPPPCPREARASDH